MENSLDQHFLEDKLILSLIVKEAKLKKDDIVLEIGAGKGILTKELAKKCKKVIAIELDEKFKKDLELLNVDVRFGNALDFINYLKFNKIVANIPYSISEPLFKKLLKLDFDLAILMISENFFSLFSNDSKWSVIAKIFFDIKKIKDVSKECFNPKPRVDSVLIKLKKRKSKLTIIEKIIKEFVLQDDKKVKNALKFAIKRIGNLTKNQAEERMYKLGIPLNLFEKNVDYLSNEQFMIVYNKIINKKV